MLKYQFYILLFIAIIPLSNYSQDFGWVRQIKGINDYREYATFIEVDDLQNNYTLGKTESRLFDIDPTITGVQIINNTITQFTDALSEIYLIKNDENGNFLWGRTYSISKANDEVYGLKIGPDGYIYILAMIHEYIPSTNNNLGYVSIIKVDSNGNEVSRIKLRNLGPINSGRLWVNSFDIDLQSNFYISGRFLDNVKLDLNNPLVDLNANGLGTYIIKVSNSGNVVWKNTFDFLSSENEIIKTRNDGNLNLILDSVDQNNNYTQRLYLINNLNGNVIWEKSFPNQRPELFHISNNNKLIICSYWNEETGSSIDVDPSTDGTVLLNGNGFTNRYFLWLDENGDFLNVYEYKNFGSNIIYPKRITSDSNSNYYFVGRFSGLIDFDPTQNTHFSTNPNEGFFIKFDSNYNFISAFNMGDKTPFTDTSNLNYDFVFRDLKVRNENLYLTGEFSWWADFDLSNNIELFGTINNSTINDDGFILKLFNCDTSIPQGNQNQTFCSNQNPTIANLAPNSNIIKWYNSPTSTTQLLSTSTLVNGQTYYAAKQVGSCLESSDRLAVTVSINQSPLPPIISNQSFCEIENATISDLVAIGQNLKWYDSLTGGNILTANTMLQNNTTYYVSQTINNCESIRASVNITITPNQTPISNSPQQFCIQENATLNDLSITGQNIKWYDAPTAGNLLTNTTLLQNGTTYYASQTINSCESTRVPVTVTIQNTPAPTGSTAQSFCSSQNATLNDITISGTNIIWYSSLTGNTVLPATTLVANNTTYYATQMVNNCESPTRFSITTTLINTLNANNHSETICDDLNNGSETVNLSNYNTDLIASTSGAVFSYYHSQNGAENQISSDQITNYSNFNLSVGNHLIFVRIDSANGCHQIVELNLTLASKPSIPITDIMPICEGSDITVSAGTGFNSYLWSTAETSSSITITTPGNYSVTVTENHGSISCSSVKNFTVVNSNAATISNIVTTDWTSNQNTISVLLTSNSTGNYLYSIDGVHYQTSNTFTNLPHGEYTVFVKDDNGCGIRTEDVYLLMYPNFFTPNGDGFNDYWKIEFSEYEPNLNVQIFDRYGKLLKELGANSQGWNGTYLGNPVPSSDYWFVVKRQNGKEYRGHFSLKR